MSNQDERLGSLLILSDLALIISTYGVLFAFNYFIEPINANTWIVCTFFVGIKILLVGISDITGIGRYYIVSLLFVLFADVIIFMINQLMAFSLSLRLILFMTIADMVMVLIAVFIWKRIARHNFRPIEPEGIRWDDDYEDDEESEVNQPVLETGTTESSDVFHFDSIEPEEKKAVNENIKEDVAAQAPESNEGFMNFNEITEELPTQEEIEKQLALEEELVTAENMFDVETQPVEEKPLEEISNIDLFVPEEPEESEKDILFTTNEGPLFADDKLSQYVGEEFFSENEAVEPEASQLESLEEANEVVDEVPEQLEVQEEAPLEVGVEEAEEFEPTLEEPFEEQEEAKETEVAQPVETIFTTSEEAEPVAETPEEPIITIEPEPEEQVVESTSEEEPEIPIGEEFNIFNYTNDQIFSEEQSKAEVLEEADSVEEQASTTSAVNDLFNIPLFNEESEPITEEEPIMTTAEDEEDDSFYVDNIYDYNEITGSTIGFDRRFSPIPFNVTQEQLNNLTSDVKSEMIRFNSNLSKLIEAYNDSLPSSKSNEKINDMVTLKDQDSINDADRIIRNKIDLLNQKDFVSEGLIHNFVEIINKLNNRLYSIEIAQENLNEKIRLEKEREEEQKRQQRLWEETHKPVKTQPKESVSEVEPVLSDSEVLLRNDDMDIIIDSADLELLKEFMAQQEKS